MPFTLSHAAAALPFRRTRLVMSALVVGCFAPDAEYFIPFSKQNTSYGHTLPGVFLYDVPLALVLLWLFHCYAKEPLAACLPDGARERLHLGPRSLSIRSFSRFVLIVCSILVGIATHILWDSFTHPGYWLYRHWHFLRETVPLPLFGPRQWCDIFQYISSALGLAIVFLWFLHWYRNTTPVHSKTDRRFVIHDRIVVSCALTLALISALLHAAASGLPNGVHGAQRFMTESAVTAITVFWIEVLIYGIIRNHGLHTAKPA
jgi:hypothetical protein